MAQLCNRQLWDQGGFLQQAPSRTVPLGRDDASSVPGRVRSRRIVAETRRTKKTPDTTRYKKSVISRHRHTGNQVVGCCTVLSEVCSLVPFFHCLFSAELQLTDSTEFDLVANLRCC